MHDLLLRLGDLSRDETGRAHRRRRRCCGNSTSSSAGVASSRCPWPASRDTSPSRTRPAIATRSVRRCRSGCPSRCSSPWPDAAGDLVQRFARTHGPFTTATAAARFGLSCDGRAADAGAAAPRPGASSRASSARAALEREWCGADVLRTLRQRSLARLRKEIEPVEADALGRFAAAWQGAIRRRRGLDALLDAIEQLQGAPIVASALERDVLPARIDGYDPADLDRLIAAGEVTWVGTRAARRARRPSGVVPHRSSAAAVATRARRRGRRATSSTASSTTWDGMARPSSRRCMPASAVAFRRSSSTRCGRWSGAVS